MKKTFIITTLLFSCSFSNGHSSISETPIGIFYNNEDISAQRQLEKAENEENICYNISAIHELTKDDTISNERKQDREINAENAEGYFCVSSKKRKPHPKKNKPKDRPNIQKLPIENLTIEIPRTDFSIDRIEELLKNNLNDDKNEYDNPPRKKISFFNWFGGCKKS